MMSVYTNAYVFCFFDAIELQQIKYTKYALHDSIVRILLKCKQTRAARRKHTHTHHVRTRTRIFFVYDLIQNTFAPHRIAYIK